MKHHLDAVFKSNVPLAEHTTLRIGGPARLFCRATRGWEVERAVETATAEGIPWRIIGEGSNILANDEGVDAAVIAFRGDRPPYIDPNGLVVASGGTPLTELAFFCAAEGLAGMEKLAGIPGTVGGAIAGNAGAYGATISDHLESVKLLCGDGSRVTLAASELGFDYRTSTLKTTGEIVLEAHFRLPLGLRIDLIKALNETLLDRREKHPDYRQYPTVGSFFKNLPPPPGDSKRQAAGHLLEQVGAKELRIGDAGLWHKHANIVVNYGKASASDIRQLTDEMAKRVRERFGITLEPEVTSL